MKSAYSEMDRERIALDRELREARDRLRQSEAHMGIIEEELRDKSIKVDDLKHQVHAQDMALKTLES